MTNSEYNFDFLSELGGQKKTPTVKRLFMRVGVFSMGANQNLFVCGIDILTKQPVCVRLSSVDESVADMQVERKMTADDALKKIKYLYTTSPNPRESLQKKHQRKSHFLSFDKARPLNSTMQVDGVSYQAYRAHWAETMSTSPTAECYGGLANVVIRQHLDNKPVGYIDTLCRSVMLSPDNVAEVKSFMTEALQIKDHVGGDRGYKIYWKLHQNGKCIYTCPMYANTVDAVRENEYGQPIKYKRLSSPRDTLISLMCAEDTTSINLCASGDNAHTKAAFAVDMARLITSILTKMEITKFVSSEQLQTRLDGLKTMILSGEIQVEGVISTRMFMGSDTLNQMIKKSERQSPLNAYSRKEISETDPNDVKIISLFVPTVAVYQRHADTNNPYVVFAAPSDIFSKGSTVEDTALEVINKHFFHL